MEGLCFKRLPAPKCIAARRLCRLWAVALAPAWAGRPRRQPHVQASQQARQGEMLQQYRQQQQRNERPIPQLQGATGERLLSVLALWALTELPAGAADALPGGPPASSYYVSLGLFVVTLPGLWSLIKRSPKAKIRRRTYEVPGPAEVRGARAGGLDSPAEGWNRPALSAPELLEPRQHHVWGLVQRCKQPRGLLALAAFQRHVCMLSPSVAAACTHALLSPSLTSPTLTLLHHTHHTCSLMPCRWTSARSRSSSTSRPITMRSSPRGTSLPSKGSTEPATVRRLGGGGGAWPGGSWEKNGGGGEKSTWSELGQCCRKGVCV